LISGGNDNYIKIWDVEKIDNLESDDFFMA